MGSISSLVIYTKFWGVVTILSLKKLCYEWKEKGGIELAKDIIEETREHFLSGLL